MLLSDDILLFFTLNIAFFTLLFITLKAIHALNKENYTQLHDTNQAIIK